jgi:hypothetical protein
MGIYTVLSILFIVLIYRIVQRGPEVLVSAAVSEPLTIA